MSTATQPLAVPRIGVAALAHEYSVLVKARVTTLIILTTWCGAYFAAAKSGIPLLSWTVFNALLGIGLVSGGTAAINEVMERDLDARMRRTAMRPLVTKSLGLVHASVIAFGMTIGGVIYLWLTTNWQTALLTGLTSASYLLVYTPMKQVHPICTFLGAFPGAMPPLLGWVAIRGRIDPEAVVLFAIMFFWQFPHFHSIAWLYREDYENAGVRMLPVVESDGRSTDSGDPALLAGAGPRDTGSHADGHDRMDLLRRRAAAGRRTAVVQRAHVDHEAGARGSEFQIAGAASAASHRDLPAAAVCADDAQSHGIE